VPSPSAEPGRADGGSATAETALALPAIVVVLAAVLACGQVLTAQIRCVDAARAGARFAARGEPAQRYVAAAQALAPAGSRVAATSSAGLVTVTVTASVPLPLLGAELPVGASAAADREQP
jgi:Flp pilus assembly protein TadG